MATTTAMPSTARPRTTSRPLKQNESETQTISNRTRQRIRIHRQEAPTSAAALPDTDKSQVRGCCAQPTHQSTARGPSASAVMRHSASFVRRKHRVPALREFTGKGCRPEDDTGRSVRSRRCRAARGSSRSLIGRRRQCDQRSIVVINRSIPHRGVTSAAGRADQTHVTGE